MADSQKTALYQARPAFDSKAIIRKQAFNAVMAPVTSFCAADLNFPDGDIKF